MRVTAFDLVYLFRSYDEINETGVPKEKIWTGPFTREEFIERADEHERAAEKAERIGPNILYARTFRACALALRIAADHL